LPGRPSGRPRRSRSSRRSPSPTCDGTKSGDAERVARFFRLQTSGWKPFRQGQRRQRSKWHARAAVDVEQHTGRRSARDQHLDRRVDILGPTDAVHRQTLRGGLATAKPGHVRIRRTARGHRKGTCFRLAVVAVRKQHPGHAKRVMFGVGDFLRQFMYTKLIVVTDYDVDIRDWKDVIRATQP
jgi:hypothetical protein